MASITSQLSGSGGTTGFGQATIARTKANTEATNQYALNTYKTSAKNAGQ